MKRKIFYAYPMRLFVLVTALLMLLVILQAQQLWNIVTCQVAPSTNKQKIS